MEIDLLSNPSKVASPKLIKKLADIYFTHVTQTAESTFYISTRQMALWKSQMEDHTSEWLRLVPISGLGQTMNNKTYWCVLCYRLGVPYSPFRSRAQLAQGSLRGIFIETTLISVGKEVDIGLGGGRDKPLRLADMYDFLPFSFSSFGELEKDAVTLLKRI
ncbi:hypothetical protein Tco_0445056 [Tanacetum coccineum]